jgi:AAA+ ATPase superfamily predicted ATPase
MLLQPLPCASLREFLPGRTVPQLVEFYGLAGGVPRYLEMVAAYPDFAVAFRELVLQRHGLLYREARSVLQEEVTKPNTCWSILQALGSGVTRITELGGRLALPANQLTRYIELLRDLFLVRRDVPILETNPARSKKGVYEVTDPFLGLWFGCVYPYESLLEFDESVHAAERLAPLVEGHMARCFERLCREYVARRLADYGCVRVGRQWGAHCEIDVAGVSDRERLAVVGECKWSKRPVGLSLLHDLQRKLTTERLPAEPSLRFILFCPAGFSADLEAEARRDGRIELVWDPFAPVAGSGPG